MADQPFDWDLPYPSRRAPVLARNVVASSQPLAVQAGITLFERGGNAVDAALATAIALVVVEPTNTGLGSDAFAMVWDGHRLSGLNASGRSPAALDPERFSGAASMPMLGWDSVTVPGAVSAWCELSRRYGRKPFADLFEPAIRYARDGFLVSPITAALWQAVTGLYRDFPEFAAAFLPRGRAPRAGELFRPANLAASLERIAESDGEAFYRGDLARAIAEHAKATGGRLSFDDMAAHACEAAETISVDYREWRLHELPPNGQGLAALVALGILSRFPLAEHAVDGADSVHLQLEAMKVGMAVARRYVADPETMDVDVAELLSSTYLDERAGSIRLDRASDPHHGRGLDGDTVYLTAADADGLMVSFIQSNYLAFGSGVVVPETGISLQNRAACFVTEPGHPNAVGPAKRPLHTILPAFVTRAGRPLMSFGVMGGNMQPQGHVQTVVRMADYAQNPQAALDAPRWQVFEGLGVGVEPGFDAAVASELSRRGHRIRTLEPVWFGGGQAIYRLDEGYFGASDWRKDGIAAGL